MRRSAPPLAIVLLLTVLLAACCPTGAPPPTAFTARLQPLGNGMAVARLSDGRRITVTGLTRVPQGLVYLQGRLLQDGRVAVTDVRPLQGRPGG